MALDDTRDRDMLEGDSQEDPSTFEDRSGETSMTDETEDDTML